MTATEITDWINYHCAAFPGLRKWLHDNSETLEHWQRALSASDLTAAKQVTDKMLSGELECPKGWSEHVRVVRQNARAFQFQATAVHRPTMHDGEPTYNCATCCDSGLVPIVEPASVRAVQEWVTRGEGELRPPVRITHAVCDCRNGEQFSVRFASAARDLKWDRKSVGRYDRQVHVLARDNHPTAEEIFNAAHDMTVWRG